MNFKTRIVEVAIWGAVLVFCLLVCISKCRADDGKLEHDRIVVERSEFHDVEFFAWGLKSEMTIGYFWIKDVDTQKKYLIFTTGSNAIAVVEDNSQIENCLFDIRTILGKK